MRLPSIRDRGFPQGHPFLKPLPVLRRPLAARLTLPILQEQPVPELVEIVGQDAEANVPLKPRPAGSQGHVSNVRAVLSWLFGLGEGGKFFFPSRITVGPDETVYVSDSFNHKIQAFTTEGSVLSQWGGWGIWGGRFRIASDIAADGKGNVYVADYLNNRIQRFQHRGTHYRYVEQWGEQGSGQGQLWGPTAVAVDNHGLIHVSPSPEASGSQVGRAATEGVTGNGFLLYCNRALGLWGWHSAGC